MNATTTTTTTTRSYAINAGLYGEFYVISTTTGGAITISPSFPTMLAASEFIASL